MSDARGIQGTTFPPLVKQPAQQVSVAVAAVRRDSLAFVEPGKGFDY
jgi:hypothetical protein